VIGGKSFEYNGCFLVFESVLCFLFLVWFVGSCSVSFLIFFVCDLVVGWLNFEWILSFIELGVLFVL